MKCCKKCEQIKSEDNFYLKRYSNGKVGLRSYCKSCGTAERDAWRKSSPKDNERNKAYNRENARSIRGNKLTKYWPGSTWQQALEYYQALHTKQQGVCAICKRPERRKHKVTGTLWDLAVDHCHTTNVVRGLLCNACNRGIGLLGDSNDTLIVVRNYLASSKKAA